LTTPCPIIAISGGVGGAKLARGLASVVGASDLMAVANVGDDFEHLGLAICPDIDSLLYGLSERNDEARGWGRRDESWNFMAALAELNSSEAWFNLGDRDLAVHLERTRRLRAGESLSTITSDFARAFGIAARVLPVTDDRLSTIVVTDRGEMPFQQYFVAERCEPKVCDFRFEGAKEARVTPDVAESLRRGAGAIVVCPSNPFISVDPILAVPEFLNLLRGSAAPIVAVSPIVGGMALKGPAAKMLIERGRECSALGIARHYQGLIDGIVIDQVDEYLAEPIRALGIAVSVEATIMKTDSDKTNLARRTLAFSENIRQGKKAE
jgi:LPPG:FO 2-phospho-L-lactate transferase